ncbi:hypothetical protein PCANB_002783 [Pneumocystis canis]|nr:hypothetical protein PCANB_002783 [Pneumocystis canis]
MEFRCQALVLHALIYVTLFVYGRVETIQRRGNFLFYSNGERFFIKGIAYQPQPSLGSTKHYTDPLGDPKICSRDLPYFLDLGINTLRVYTVDPELDHTYCMNLFAESGIYVLLDLSEPRVSIISTNPSWDVILLYRYIKVIDSMINYPNLIGFFAGNEVVLDTQNTHAAAFVKAAIRDIKAYIKHKKYRNVLVGYAANDHHHTRIPSANYFACGDSDSAADFFGINIYEWCEPTTYETSGYKDRVNDFSNFGIPLFFSEYGCNIVNGNLGVRTFKQIQYIYSRYMTSVFSGGIVYEWFQGENSYGLVDLLNDGTISPRKDYLNLKMQLNLLKSSPPDNLGDRPTFSSPQCPSINEYWSASTSLPPVPNSELCSCASSASSCVAVSDITNKEMEDIFSYVCSKISCRAISKDGKAGVYGAYSVCNPIDQLNVILGLYHSNFNDDSACNFKGTTYPTEPRVSKTCSSLLRMVGPDGTGTITGPPYATEHTKGDASQKHKGGSEKELSMKWKLILGLEIAIRRKIENELSKKKPTAARMHPSRKMDPKTVLSLSPSPPLTVQSGITVSEASQLMAAKREDCVLVVDDNQHLMGIFTAKDLAFRVVGMDMDPRNLLIEDIMTKNPLCARNDTSATDALDLMVHKGFRHLPVCDEDGNVSGILDITKCFHEAMKKVERAYTSSRQLYDALEGVQTEWGQIEQSEQIIQYVETLKQKMSGPNLASALDGTTPITVNIRTSVRDAAFLMRENHTTAVLVMDQMNISGIFTSKDIVLRVIAPGLDPANCSVVRVMTPHPDCVPMDMSIQEALKKMDEGRYLNLPVLDQESQVIGMVDVMKLTYLILEQIKNIGSPDGEGLIWNRFWNNLEDGDSESILSDNQLSTSQNYQSLLYASLPNNQQDIQVLSPDTSATKLPQKNEWTSPTERPTFSGKNSPLLSQIPFVFKFKSLYGKTHRIQLIPQAGYASLRLAIIERLRSELEKLGGSDDLAISFIDDEGDSVSMTTDDDMFHAVELAYKNAEDKVNLIIHHPNSSIINQKSDDLSSITENHHNEKASQSKSPKLTGYFVSISIAFCITTIAIVYKYIRK